MFFLLLQIYIGPSRGRVHENRDVVKELKVGMLVATTGPAESTIAQVGIVQSIEGTSSLNSKLTVNWMAQEKASHKPKWLRSFKISTKKDSLGTITFNDILLYDFELTKNGTLKKKSRDYLQKYF